MLVPVIGVPANVTEALAAGSVEFVGPCQYRRALVMLLEAPLRVIELLPDPPRIPPTPAETTSVLDTVIWFPSWLAAAGFAGIATSATTSTALSDRASPRRRPSWVR